MGVRGVCGWPVDGPWGMDHEGMSRLRVTLYLDENSWDICLDNNYTIMLLRLCVFFVFIFSFSFSQTIRINEVAASNSIFQDEDGDTPDWIELYNYGSEEISLN